MLGAQSADELVFAEQAAIEPVALTSALGVELVGVNVHVPPVLSVVAVVGVDPTVIFSVEPVTV